MRTEREGERNNRERKNKNWEWRVGKKVVCEMVKLF